jgi:hypothetical protein
MRYIYFIALLFLVQTANAQDAFVVEGTIEADTTVTDSLSVTGHANINDLTITGTCVGCGGATTEAELESNLSDVSNVFTDNDGALDDDDLTDDSITDLSDVSAISGNSTTVVTTTGAQTDGDCTEWDANGNLVASGDACGEGSGHVIYDEESESAMTQRDSLGFSADFTLTDHPAGGEGDPARTIASIAEYVQSLFGSSGALTDLTATGGDITIGSSATLKYSPIEGTATGSTTLDLTAQNTFVYTVTGDITLENPTVPADEDTEFSITFTQDATGGHQITSHASKWYTEFQLLEDALATTLVKCVYKHTDDIAVCNSQGDSVTKVEGAYDKQQYSDASAVATATTSYEWDLSDDQVLRLSLETDITTFTFTGQQAGATYMLVVDQDTGADDAITFPAGMLFPGGDPTITATADAVDVISCVSDGTSLFCTYAQAFE